ncbi:MAG: HsdR family type I site-specific deoxyribonuclease, partial [Oscillatoriales cyanobacterium]
MTNFDLSERATQNRIIQLFQTTLGYHYLGNWHSRDNNRNLEPDHLTRFLTQTQGYNPDLSRRAISKLTDTARLSGNKLYEANHNTYQALRYGLDIKPDASSNTQTLHPINWEHPDRNHFAIAEEVSIKGENNKRPDIVIYINGIAIATIELKRASVNVSEGIRQNLDNQQSDFIQSFFSTIQLTIAGNDSQGLRYGTIGTPEKYYLTWKEPDPSIDPEIDAAIAQLDHPCRLDRDLIQLCHKPRLLEILHDFIVFDKSVKKLCRPHQYFGIKAAQHHLKQGEGGILWHTQGSGKSLTMVWLAKWILEHNPDARILLVTDRDELDRQIEGVFSGVNETITRTSSGRDLLDQLNATTPRLLCSLVHKFGSSGKTSEGNDAFITQLTQRPQDFHAKGQFYVFVDECHRTQSGKLHTAMKSLLPTAIFIGFTGTPLLKDDKTTTLQTFGRYLHTYKFDEAVRDDVVLDLRYEARNVEQYVKSQDKIDRWFDRKTAGLTEFAKAELKKKWGTMQNVLSSKSRLEVIVADIMLDFEERDRLSNGRGNAMLVASSVYEACRYWELFQQAGFKSCAVVSSYQPTAQSIKGETTGDETPTQARQKYEIYQEMLGDEAPENFEQNAKKAFIDRDDDGLVRLKLLIVVDKLLTGFDAPSATVLYIDKSMRDHGLFQAICRVNRLDGEDKEVGYIVDYKDLFRSIETSITDYTSEALSSYDEADIAGLLSDRLDKAEARLKETRDRLLALCEAVPQPQDPTQYTAQYIRYFCGTDTQDPEALQTTAQRRHDFYKYTAAFLRAYANIANDLADRGYSKADRQRLRDENKRFVDLRNAIKLASNEQIDLKVYEPDMRHLIDTYLGANDSESIATFEDLTLVQLILDRGIADTVAQLPDSIRKDQTAVAETIDNNIRSVITDERATNPKYFDRMSELLRELVDRRQAEAIDYEEYLKQVAALARNVARTGTSEYPSAIDTRALQALYDFLDGDEPLALQVDTAVRVTKKDGWRDSKPKQRQVRSAIKTVLPETRSDINIEELLEIIRNQSE